MTKKRNNQYWSNRSNELLANIHEQSTPYILEINKYYDKALKDLQKDINHIFNTYQAGHGLSRAQAKRILNSKMPNFIRDIIKRVYPRLKDGKIKSWMLAELNSQAYRARITRLEALKKAIQIHYMSVADEQLTLSKMAYINTIKESYYKVAYNLQKGINVGFYLAQIPEHTIKAVLNTNWSGKLYSERIWNNSQATVDAIAETLTSGFISGKSIPRMVKEIEELTEYGKYAAERLIRTETTFFANQGSIQSYRECDVEKYIFVATLDLRTSKECRSHDRKVYEVAKAMPGENLPPLHVFCRSTTRAYLGEKYMQNIQRRARDPVTGKTYLVGNMNYEEWYNKYVKGNTQAELAEKKLINKAIDKKQHARYRELLGKDVPRSLDDFQNFKYTDGDRWEVFKDYAKARKEGHISAFSKFEDYSKCKSDIENILLGMKIENVGEIKSYSKHFVDRVLGASKDPKTNLPRSGVKVEDIKDSLLSPLKIKNEPQKKSCKIIGEMATISINPETGNLIQCNPTDSDLVRRLKNVSD